jgi:hypothetical protein
MGKYSLAEKRMDRAYRYMMASLHHMDGELADVTANDWTVKFARGQAIQERYSFDKTGEDVSGINPHVVMDELDWPHEEPIADADVYEELEMKFDQDDLD